MLVLSEDYSEFYICYFYYWIKTQFYRGELKNVSALIEELLWKKDFMYIRIYEYAERNSSITIEMNVLNSEIKNNRISNISGNMIKPGLNK